jgi:hypothetical protein
MGVLVPVVIAYVAVPVVMRLRVGCPAFRSKTVTLANGQTVKACPSFGWKDLLWPFGLLAGGK